MAVVPKSKNPNKHKHKARRKANEKGIQTKRTNSQKAIDEFLKNYYTGPDYPVTKSKKKRTWAQIRKLIKP